MLEHLVDEDIVEYTPDVLETPKATPLEKAKPQAVLDAQVETTKWLEELGAIPDDAIFDKEQEEKTRQSFAALTTASTPEAQKAQLTKLKTPEAVRHLVGMLTAYDWQFVEQAKELRGYAVSQLVEETKHPDAKIRLRALELLGKVTEVALFTDRVEVKKTEMSDSELDAKIKEKLGLMSKIVDITDVTEIKELEELEEPTDTDESI
jgi:hypothetical protein